MKHLHHQVWTLREEISSTWPTPPHQDCVRYAVCEAAEAMDKWLRVKHPTHARNHERPADINAELADCAMMLLSALGPIWQPAWYVQADVGDLDTICEEVATMLLWYTDEDVLRILAMIDSYPDMDLEKELTARLERIRHRHG